MLILLFIIFVGLFILGSMFIDEYKHDGLKFSIQIFTSIGAIIVVIMFAITAYQYSQTVVIDEMIEMYAEENENIENQINVVVNKYMEFENDTFTSLKSESSITLVSLYPELKSDQLVQTQINTYQSNNAQLKKLKEQKINAKIYKWWLFFGK